MINAEPSSRLYFNYNLSPNLQWQTKISSLWRRNDWNKIILPDCCWYIKIFEIFQILTAKNYALILGMPGTGKTSTMVHAVKALLMRGASILLTSYTNSAVDNLLIKLRAQVIIHPYQFIRQMFANWSFREKLAKLLQIQLSW